MHRYKTKLYTEEIGKYYTIELSEDGKGIIRIPYTFERKEPKITILKDEMHDFLIASDVLPYS